MTLPQKVNWLRCGFPFNSRHGRRRKAPILSAVPACRFRLYSSFAAQKHGAQTHLAEVEQDQ